MKKLLTLTVLLSIFFTSCNKYLDINEDPNNFQGYEVESKMMIKGVMLSNQFWQTANGARISMIWMNQATGADNQYIGLNNWNSVSSTEFNQSWNEAYSGTMFAAQQMIDKATTENKMHIVAIGKVLQAQTMGMVASLWGDVPYTQAFQPAVFSDPVFDSQISVYQKVQNTLSEAIDLFNNITDNDELTKVNSEISVFAVLDSETDHNYTSISQWTKLAHALKARFYLHVKDYTSALNEVNLAFNDANDDFYAVFLNTDGANNPFYSFNKERQGYMNANNAYGMKLLKSGQPEYRGHSKTNEARRLLTYYISNTQNLNYTQRFKINYDLPLVTYGEMLLIKAECQARLSTDDSFDDALETYNVYRNLLETGYFLLSSAPNMYKDFVASDFEPNGIENTAPLSITSPKNAFLRELYQERYVYFIGNYESFTDYRRTNNIAEIQLRNFDNTPQRFIYPMVEVNSNSNTPNPIPDVYIKTPVHQ